MKFLKLISSGLTILRERGLSAVLDQQVATTIPEITPFALRAESGDSSPRLNLLLPSINPEHYFGGAHTAMQLYRSLLERFPRSRIILLDSHPREEALARFPDHVAVDCSADTAAAPRQIVAFNQRYGHTIPAGPSDRWVATAWWTAFAAQSAAAWQHDQGWKHRPVLYLIQDYEPGFYPWSSQSAVAASTYRPATDLAVFNTTLLRDYFVQQGYRYDAHVVLEPTLNDSLRPVELLGERRERVILVYARPSVPRNALPLICEGLREWGWKDARCKNWNVLGIGELDRDLDLGPFTLRGLGKLSLAEYRERLQRSAVGVSLMLSPHPSYPPLEMAAYGMSVITNSFANKDLSTWFANVSSIAQLSPTTLAQTLAAQIDGWERNDMQQRWQIPVEHPYVTAEPLPAQIHEYIRSWVESVW